MDIEGLRSKLHADRRLTLQVKVTPKSSKNEITGVLEDGTLKLKIAAVPEKGEANAAICEFLAGVFRVPKGRVEITRGQTASIKQVSISL